MWWPFGEFPGFSKSEFGVRVVLRLNFEFCTVWFLISSFQPISWLFEFFKMPVLICDFVGFTLVEFVHLHWFILGCDSIRVAFVMHLPVQIIRAHYG